MNHFKTTCITLLFFLTLGGNFAYGKLNRALKPNEISKLMDNIKKNPNNHKSRYFLADHYFLEENWQEVINVLAPINEGLPDSQVYQISVSYYKKANYRQAESMVNMLLSKPKVKTKSYLLAGRIYSGIIDHLDKPILRQSLVDKLFETLKQANQKDPSNRKIYEAWLTNLEKYVEYFAVDALPVMEKMKENKVKFLPKDYSRLCRYNHLAQFTNEAKTACQAAIGRDPDNPSNLIFLGQSHINSGNKKEGQRMLASVGKKFSESEEALWATAQSYYESKNLASAYKFYKKASQHKDAQPRDFLGLAQSAFELKKYGVALRAFSEHCYRTNFLDHEFRRASGLLKEHPKWQEAYRKKMNNCKPLKKIK